MITQEHHNFHKEILMISQMITFGKMITQEHNFHKEIFKSVNSTWHDGLNILTKCSMTMFQRNENKLNSSLFKRKQHKAIQMVFRGCLLNLMIEALFVWGTSNLSVSNIYWMVSFKIFVFFPCLNEESPKSCIYES